MDFYEKGEHRKKLKVRSFSVVLQDGLNVILTIEFMFKEQVSRPVRAKTFHQNRTHHHIFIKRHSSGYN